MVNFEKTVAIVQAKVAKRILSDCMAFEQEQDAAATDEGDAHTSVH